jgi:hypothetical protein
MLAPGRRIMQTAFIVNDLEAACMKWVKTTGIGPFLIAPHLKLDTLVYRGKKNSSLEFSLAIAQSDGVQVELIQQHCDNPSAYRDTISKGKEGFHHICLYPEDYDATYQWYVKQGYAVAIDGVFGETRFSYLDTSADIGCMVEILEQNPVQTDFFQRVVDAANTWDGKTDPIRPAFPG